MASKTDKALLTRKAWVIQEIGWEYNDEYYYRAESQGGKALKVYFDHEKAVLDCVTANRSRAEQEVRGEYPMENRDGETIREFYELVEVEVA